MNYKVSWFNLLRWVRILLKDSREHDDHLTVLYRKIAILETKYQELATEVIKQHPQIKLKHRDDRLRTSGNNKEIW